MQVSVVTMSRPSLRKEKCCSTSLFTTGYKRLAEGGCEDFGWGRFFDGGFWLKGNFWREIAEGRISKGKRTAEGELLKGNC
jgi:hypothetical protein